MKTLSFADETLLEGIGSRMGYDIGSPGYGPKVRAFLEDLGALAADNNLALVASYDAPMGASIPTAPVTYLEVVIDVSHNNPYTLDQLAAKGVLAVIHKASQFKADDLYVQRKAEALAAGLLWGAYHFSTNRPGIEQADLFLSVEDGSDPNIALVLDWEDANSGAPDMPLVEARAFCQRIKENTGRWPMVYGSNRPRELVSQTGPDPVLSNCPLWIAEIGPAVKPLPPTWPDWTLWQYCDASLLQPGQPGYSAMAVAGGWDWNRFRGSADDLRREWPFTHS